MIAASMYLRYISKAFTGALGYGWCGQAFGWRIRIGFWAGLGLGFGIGLGFKPRLKLGVRLWVHVTLVVVFASVKFLAGLLLFIPLLNHFRKFSA